MPEAPLPSGLIAPKIYSKEEIDIEALRLQKAINQVGLWNLETCRTIAPLTLEINELKHEKDVFLIAHSYQTPDIVYGVADSVSDSYSLSKAARDA
ncbi:MAG TPA: quinolinate synthase NadA, partial [Candidatus Thalassarchaeaceae archaeon]|nr:quinolinate synthase NadA [Candidatus Thalassarchaeaceae archaeon]